MPLQECLVSAVSSATLRSHPVTQHSFHICVLEQGRACTECTHQLFHEQIPYSWGWLGMFPKGCQAVFWTCQASSLVLSQFLRQGLAPCRRCMARNKAKNIVKGSLMGSLKAHGRKRQKFACCHCWVSFSRGNLDCFWYFLSSCKHNPPRWNRGHFYSREVVAERERCAGENRIPVQEETVLLEKHLSGLMTCTHSIYNIPRSSLQIVHNNALWRDAPTLSTCLV